MGAVLPKRAGSASTPGQCSTPSHGCRHLLSSLLASPQSLCSLLSSASLLYSAQLSSLLSASLLLCPALSRISALRIPFPGPSSAFRPLSETNAARQCRRRGSPQPDIIPSQPVSARQRSASASSRTFPFAMTCGHGHGLFCERGNGRAVCSGSEEAAKRQW